MMRERETDCESYRKLLEEHLLGDPDAEAPSFLAAHETRCAACAAEGRALRDVVGRLGALREARSADPVFQEATAGLLDGPRSDRGLRPSHTRPHRPAASSGRPYPLLWAGGIAAACLALFIGSYVTLRRDSQEPAGTGASRAAAAERAGDPLVPGPAPVPSPQPPAASQAEVSPEPLAGAPKDAGKPPPEPPAPEAARPDGKPREPKLEDPRSDEAQKPPLFPSRPRGTVATSLLIESLRGNVLATVEGRRTSPKAGQSVPEGQGIETVGRESVAVLRRHDGSRLALGPDTEVLRQSKGIFVAHGVLQADVVPQAPQEPMTFLTPQARAEVPGARLTLSVRGEETRLDVEEGRAGLTRSSDGASAVVKSGHYAVAAPRVPLLARPQDKKPDVKVDQIRIDAAIDKGAHYLKRLNDFGAPRAARKDELVLLTLIHSGVPAADPAYQRLFRTMMEGPLEKTYSVVLQAMILEEVDRVRHQGRIAQCGQYLLDNQCRNGQWSYGEPTVYSVEMPRDVATGAKERGEVREFLGPGEKPRVVRRIPVKKQREGPPAGDNSNTQYAALGLRACHDAGIVFPKEWVRLARNWWTASQHDGTNDPYAGRGWSYREKGDFHPYGSMTAGAVGGVVIYDFMLDENWRRDLAVIRGLEWMARNFTVTENPGPPEPHGGGLNHYYYLYAMERLGILYGTEKLGVQEWYPVGARYLLDAQRADGSWQADDPVTDTCFAILFLRRATRPIASQDKGK